MLHNLTCGGDNDSITDAAGQTHFQSGKFACAHQSGVLGFLPHAWHGIGVVYRRLRANVRLQMWWWSSHKSDEQSFCPAFLWRSKPVCVVSRSWPWLQVIKALLSFCQSSDSPNISACLISAVSSIRAYTKPWKDQHLVPVFAIRSCKAPSEKLT